MKFFPSVFNSSFDDLFNSPLFSSNQPTMKTDIIEKDDCYLLDMELPGFNKEDIEINLDHGYLNITATRQNNNETKDDAGNIIRQERYSGSVSRSFYVGDQVSDTDIKASYDNGELKVTFPKDTPEISNKKRICIE